MYFRDLGATDLILNWKDKTPLTYRTFTGKFCEENSLTAKRSQDHKTILVAVPSPCFTQKLSFHINGILTFKSKNSGHQTEIPTIVLEASDTANNDCSVKKTNLIAGDKESLLALMAASEESKLFAHFFRGTSRNITRLLEINCFFRRVGSKDLNLFYAGEASDYFDGMIVQHVRDRDNISYLNIYSR